MLLVTLEYARAKPKAEAGGGIQVPSRSEGKQGVLEKLIWMSAGDELSPRLSVGPEWNESHEAGSLLSHHHLHRSNEKMKLSKFLRLPNSNRRARSKSRSEIGSIEGQNEPGQATPRPTESTPDLRINPTILPTLGILDPRDQEPGSRSTTTYARTNLATSLMPESLDVFPALKSVAGVLSAIIDHCEVYSISSKRCRP